MKKDRIYATAGPIAPFKFSADVASVFPDMIRRSVPGYLTTLETIANLAGRYAQSGSVLYDLGCSLGAATLAMRSGVQAANCRIVAIDNAPAMLEHCATVIASDQSSTPVELRLADICDSQFDNASMVVMNYTLQFVSPGERNALLEKIRTGLRDGGILLISEKICFDDPQIQKTMSDLHDDFKRANAYTELEISGKRTALENVLIPDTLTQLRERLSQSGFSRSDVWLQHFNFVSLIAFQ